MARINITLPGAIAKKLYKDAKRQDIARSTLIAQHIEQYYGRKSEADFEAEIQQSRTEGAEIIQRERDEHEQRLQKLIAEHEAEMQQVRADYGKQLQQINADNAATTQQFEDELERLAIIVEKLDIDLKTSAEREASDLEHPPTEPSPEVPAIEPAPQVPPTIDTDLEQRLKKAGILAARGVVRHPPTEPSPEVPPIEPSKQPAIEQDLKPPSIEMDEANNTEQWLLDDPRHQDVGRINHTLQLIKDQIHRVVVGKDDLIEDLYLCLLAEGNVLLEGYPGIAKTRVAKLFAQTLGCKFNRQQFTPDLLPADITGTYVFDRKTSEFYVRKGGIFSNIVMVDEINRATPRAQSALLESMEERAVTIEGTTFPLELPFMVIATEAPAGFEGTYPLPEVQLDRFTAKLKMDYPDADEELEIIDIKDRVEENTESVTDRSDLLQMIAIARQIYVGAAVKRYIRNIVMSTRQRNDLVLAASPRASIGLLRLSKALAAVRGRSFVIPDDVKAVAPIVLPHRLVVAPRFDLEGVTPETITEEILNTVEADDLSVLVPPR
ncbi:MAG: AAA family ATPase [Halobacteriota archaeon]|jgi:MoxR-like ATPase